MLFVGGKIRVFLCTNLELFVQKTCKIGIFAGVGIVCKIDICVCNLYCLKLLFSY